MSVITPSTHDMSTLRGWWEENREKTQHFYNHVMGQWGEAPQYCEAWINRAIIMQHLYSPAMWSIFQLQDLMGMNETLRRQNPHEERINVPANPKNYWQYRMHISLEDLMKEYSDEPILKRTLAAQFHRMGRTDEAIAILDALGESLMQSGDKLKAQEVINQIVMMNPPNVDDYRRLLFQMQNS